jgi:hypothetical protein
MAGRPRADAHHGHHGMHPATTTTTTSTVTKPAAGAMLTAAAVAKEGKKLYGRTVTVRAEVDDVIDSHTFTLDEDSVLAGPDVLVLVPSGLTASLEKDDVVEVTGTVRPYIASELDRDFDWFEDGKIVQRKYEVEMKERPVIVATSIRTAAGRDIAQR